MAIINCSECGNPISDKAKKCIHCGKIFEDIASKAEGKICVECGNPIPDASMECPNCGCPIPSTSKPKFQFTQKTITMLSIVISAILIICIGAAIYNSTPVQNYVSKVELERKAINVSQTAFKEAKEAEKNKDYELAIKKYKSVIKEDKSYNKAQKKIEELQNTYKNQLLSEAENYAQNKKYKNAIQNVDKLISTLGSSDEFTELKQKYADLKAAQYAKVIVTDKTVTPKSTSNWIFSNYVNLVFDITNNGDKAIKGIEGILTTSDLFGKEILRNGCDFTGHTIEPGKTVTIKGLSLECNEFNDEHMKVFNTAFADLQFSYEITNIVYTDGSTVVPE